MKKGTSSMIVILQPKVWRAYMNSFAKLGSNLNFYTLSGSYLLLRGSLRIHKWLLQEKLLHFVKNWWLIQMACFFGANLQVLASSLIQHLLMMSWFNGATRINFLSIEVCTETGELSLTLVMSLKFLEACRMMLSLWNNGQ